MRSALNGFTARPWLPRTAGGSHQQVVRAERAHCDAQGANGGVARGRQLGREVGADAGLAAEPERSGASYGTAGLPGGNFLVGVLQTE